MLEILPDVDLGYDASKPMRIAAAVHIFYDDMTDELLDRVAMLPSAYDLYVTTTDDEKADASAPAGSPRATRGSGTARCGCCRRTAGVT